MREAWAAIGFGKGHNSDVEWLHVTTATWNGSTNRSGTFSRARSPRRKESNLTAFWPPCAARTQLMEKETVRSFAAVYRTDGRRQPPPGTPAPGADTMVGRNGEVDDTGYARNGEVDDTGYARVRGRWLWVRGATARSWRYPAWRHGCC